MVEGALPGDRAREVFDPGSSAPAEARVFVERMLERLGCGHLADEVGLVVGELASNAVLHGSGEVEVEVARHEPGVRVVVSDAGRGRPRLGTSEATTDGWSASPGGLGLVIVDRVSRAWGVDDLASGGKTVWADLA